MNILKTQSKKLIIFEIVCILVMICMIGITYSFFTATATNTGEITGSAASMNISLTVTKESPNNTKGLVPQLDEYITSAVTGRNGSCVDDNNNNVCQVYKITVKNASAASNYISGKLELNAGNNQNLKWAEISGLTNPTLKSMVKRHDDITLASNVFFTAQEQKEYYIVVWISETGEIQTDSGSFSGTVTFGNISLSENTLTNLGLEDSVNETELTTFTTTSKLDNTTGIYKAQDNLGTSYYFRGNVNNNYVKFAGYYWRIIRINGDGSIRMIYDGQEAYANNASNKVNYISYTEDGTTKTTSKYNINSDDNAYVGYMYGTAGSTTYEATHSNTNDSTIKTVLDNWYVTNIKNAGYGDYVADAIYCNDRKIATNSDLYTALGATGTGTGIGTSVTIYGFWDRVALDLDNETCESITPTLLCSQANDKFTVNSTIGNGALTYPIGLITDDEIAYAGGYIYLGDNYANDEMYLYDSNGYWTMSPFGFGVGNAYGGLGYKGALYIDYFNVNYSLGVRPVISLSSNAIKYGVGTSTNPFRLTSEYNGHDLVKDLVEGV